MLSIVWYARVRLVVFFFNDTATTEIYTLSLHDALPISVVRMENADLALSYRRSILHDHPDWVVLRAGYILAPGDPAELRRSEEHTSELQSRQYLVCRLLLEKKKKRYHIIYYLITTSNR